MPNLSSDTVPARFWDRTPADAFSDLASRPEGLSDAEAQARLASFGPNATIRTARRMIGTKIVRRLAEPLITILLVAAAISGATGDLASCAIIVVIVLVSVGLDVLQEHRAERAVDALRRSIAVRARIRRDGRYTERPVEDVVPGDVISLEPGDLVPADGIVLESRNGMVNEALLTGEPYPVEKRVGPSDAEEPSEAFDALFGGTALVSGRLTMLVVATGARTRFGGIASALEADEPPTAFERGLHQLGVLILRLTTLLVLFVLLAHLAFHRPALEAFMFAVALAVGLTPELLPMVTTVTLSRGALRMARKRVIVKRLAAIHDFGAIDVLCTDKTGTLTEARIALVGHPGPDGLPNDGVLALAALNSRLSSGLSSALDAAILDAARQRDPGKWSRVAELPFDFERRRATVLARCDDRQLLVVKGAPEEVLALCVAVGEAGGAVAPLNDATRERLTALHDARASEGQRLLGVAFREMPADPGTIAAADERDLVFAGWCAFIDPPKASAAAAVARLERLGVRVKIVSGDAAPVVRHLVQTLGLPAEGLLTGAEIATMSDAALAARAQSVDLYARVSPDQKMRVIRALRARGHTIGFMGDGINDAPAIKAADCGLSVDGATDVARAAADLILLEPDLGVLADGVEEGRRTYANITKYVRMGTSSNFGNMLSMALASLAIPFLPLTAVQILLNNLLYDLSETGIPFDDVDASETAAPHAWDMAAVLRFTLVMGPLSSLFDAATFGLLLFGFSASPGEFRTAWFVESIATQVLVIFLIRTAGRPWASRPHPALVATSLGAISAGLFAALGPAAPYLGFAPLPLKLLGAIAALVVAYLCAAELLKGFAMRARNRHSRRARVQLPSRRSRRT
ncbi:magnesium-translocating P-type ATPase [Alsobacter sp. R-9]